MPNQYATHTLEVDSSGERNSEADAPITDEGTQHSTASDNINRSDAIRDYLQEHPGAKPATIQRDLSDQGIEVSKALIANIKHRLKQKEARLASNKSHLLSPAMADDAAVSVPALILAKELVDQVGSIEKAKQAIYLLKTLT